MKLTELDFEKAAQRIGCEAAVIKAVTDVESRGSGFHPNGSVVILFEGHIFSRYTQGRFDKTHPTISYPKWTKKFYLGGIREYERFNAALALDREAALKSTSYGLFQVMGFNFAKCGFAGVESFYTAMCESEGAQLQAFVQYIKAVSLDDELRNKEWAKFACGYNGPRYAENQYDAKLSRAYKARSK